MKMEIIKNQTEKDEIAITKMKLIKKIKKANKMQIKAIFGSSMFFLQTVILMVKTRIITMKTRIIIMQNHEN